jgi:hypothetical protein
MTALQECLQSSASFVRNLPKSYKASRLGGKPATGHASRNPRALSRSGGAALRRVRGARTTQEQPAPPPCSPIPQGDAELVAACRAGRCTTSSPTAYAAPEALTIAQRSRSDPGREYSANGGAGRSRSRWPMNVPAMAWYD